MSDPVLDKLQGSASNLYQARAGVNLAKLFGLGLAGGATIAGVSGLKDLWTGTQSPPPKLPLRQQFITVPVRSREKEAGPLTKAAHAFLMLKQANPPAITPGEYAAGSVLEPFLPKPGEDPGWSDTFMNFDADSLSKIPWWVMGAPLALAGGAYLGHKATSSVLGKSKDNETNSELNQAKKRYEQALIPKTANEKQGAVVTMLDALYDKLEKQASDPLTAGYSAADEILKSANNYGYGNTALGAAGLASLLIAAGSGVGAYNWSRGGDEDNSIDEALRQRREKLYAAGPPPIVAIPVPADKMQKKKIFPRAGLLGLRDQFQSKDAGAESTPAVASAMLGKFEAQQNELAKKTAIMLGAKEPQQEKALPPAAPQLPSVLNAVSA